MIISRLGHEKWKEEWVGEVQKLLEMDAGWGWRGFWDCVRRNVEVCLVLYFYPYIVFHSIRKSVHSE
jgi:hypothetical protein